MASFQRLRTYGGEPRRPDPAAVARLRKVLRCSGLQRASRLLQRASRLLPHASSLRSRIHVSDRGDARGPPSTLIHPQLRSSQAAKSAMIGFGFNKPIRGRPLNNKPSKRLFITASIYTFYSPVHLGHFHSGNLPGEINRHHYPIKQIVFSIIYSFFPPSFQGHKWPPCQTESHQQLLRKSFVMFHN